MAADDPFQYAIQLERDGQEFYARAAAQTRNPLGRKMFESLAADERRHEQIVRQMAEDLDVAIQGELPKQRLVTLFATLGPELKKKLGAEAGDTEVIQKALDMERASVAHYQTQAQQTPTEAHKPLFERLAQEESQHVQILQNTETYLNRTGEWFLWDEQALLDGG